jgi:aspartate/methionine/tyrosine aminotransferase
MPTIATAVQAVPASGIRRIFELALELEDVIQLSIGEPQLPVARHILNAGARAWDNDVTNYAANSGLTALRTAIVAKLTRDNGYVVDRDQVHVTAGGQQALHMAMTFTLDAGDEILIPDPGYATFAMTPRLIGATPVPYTLRAGNSFMPDLDDLARLITARTRVLLVNSPSNPLGTVLPRPIVRALIDFAAHHDLWVISDEVYEYLTFGAGFTSLAAVDADDRVFSVYSLSKTYALTGARVGYLVTPAGLSERFRAAQEATVSCVNTPAQLAALAAIQGDGSDIAAARGHYASNLAAACDVLDAAGIGYYRPAGAFYLWINVSHVSGADVAAWAEHFLRTERVAVAPGTAFGRAGEGWVRICIAGDQLPLVTALRRFPAPVADPARR